MSLVRNRCRRPVILRISARVSAPRLSSVCVAPSSRASVNRLGSRSTAMIGSQPAIRAAINPARPTHKPRSTVPRSGCIIFSTYRRRAARRHGELPGVLPPHTPAWAAGPAAPRVSTASLTRYATCKATYPKTSGLSSTPAPFGCYQAASPTRQSRIPISSCRIPAVYKRSRGQH